MKALMRKNRLGALAAGIAAAVLVFLFFFLPTGEQGGDIELRVQGGIILSQTEDAITVRSTAPAAVLDMARYKGRVRITNCVPGSSVEGEVKDIKSSGTDISFRVDTKGMERITLKPPPSSELNIAVIGDTQGSNHVLEDALGNMSADFMIHCGDLVPSGRDAEYDAFEETMNGSGIAYYPTPGNHDVKLDDGRNYSTRMGAMQYSFGYAGTTFAFLDSSNLSLKDSQFEWLDLVFEEGGDTNKIIVTHAPTRDPFEGNHTMDPDSASRLEEFMISKGVDLFLCGHIHAYHTKMIGDTRAIITGGGGGRLTNGSHHYVMLRISEDGIYFSKVDIETGTPEPEDFIISVEGLNSTVDLTLTRLANMEHVAGNSSYENQMNNIKGQGLYAGVRVSDIMETVGGLGEGEYIRVSAADGYYQDFGYLNVYPNQTYQEYQGDMILALSFTPEGGEPEEHPGWENGPRIAMLSPDEVYSNSDCEATSYPGQGCSTYISGGARWVKNVCRIAVLKG